MVVVSHPGPVVDLSGRTLLLGLPGDVGLLDCRGVTAGAVAELVAETFGDVPVGVRVSDPAVIPAGVAAGASLVHVASSAGSSDEVRAAARRGAVIVLAGDHEQTRSMALDLIDRGARPGQVVVELSVTFQVGVVDAEAIRGDQAAGLAVGAVLLPGPGPVDEVTGWEVGMLAHLLALGVRTVRNVPMARLRRVQAVVDAVAGGADQPDPVDQPDPADAGRPNRGDR